MEPINTIDFFLKKLKENNSPVLSNIQDKKNQVDDIVTNNIDSFDDIIANFKDKVEEENILDQGKDVKNKYIDLFLKFLKNLDFSYYSFQNLKNQILLEENLEFKTES